MRYQDLTREQLALLNTDFGEVLEKRASAIVDEEYEKVAELQEQAQSLFDYGAELAMQKIAEMEAKYDEGKKEEEGESKEEESKEDEKKEEEKTASAMGNFILEGYWNTMMEKGAEFYGDKNIYLEELVKEANFGKYLNAAKKHFMSVGRKAMKGAKDIKGGTSRYMKNRAVSKAPKTIAQAAKADAGMAAGRSRVGKGFKGIAPAAGYAAGAGALGAGTYYGLKKKSKK